MWKHVLAAVTVASLSGCGGVDAPSGADAASPDADPNAPDADPNAPDADPNAPDADPNAPDAAPPATCGGPTGELCAAGTFCDWTPDSCGLAGETGACAPIPPGPCPELYYPVCGCDHVTYGNICEANAAGQDVLYTGECATMQCGGFIGMTCDPGYFCDWTPNSCGNADQIGDCRPVPMGCPDIYDPVCACDNMTYPNECDANAAGLDIIAPGTCTLP